MKLIYKPMKRVFLIVMLSISFFTVQAQDRKSYEDKMNKLEKEYNSLVELYKTIAEKNPNSLTEADKEQMLEITVKADSLDSVQTVLTMEIVRKFKDSKFPAKYVEAAMYSLEYDELKEAVDSNSGYYNEPQMERPKKLLASFELRHPGMMFKDFEMLDLNGKTVKLSQWAGKGKYVFVDFWASWCGPCLREMPNVVEAYKRFHDKGLEIVGVSFDKDKKNWTAAVERFGMTWPQMSDLKYWESAAVSLYGIRGIPANVLLDPDGKIIALDLQGDNLQKKLEEIYK